MNITVYLPDELGHRAKDAELPFSRLLRDAVTEELQRVAELKRLEETSEAEVRTYTLKVPEKNGDDWLARIRAKRIVATDGLDVFHTDKDDIVIYGCHSGAFQIYNSHDKENISSFLKKIAPSADEYVHVAKSLGLIRIVDL